MLDVAQAAPQPKHDNVIPLIQASATNEAGSVPTEDDGALPKEDGGNVDDEVACCCNTRFVWVDAEP